MLCVVAWVRSTKTGANRERGKPHTCGNHPKVGNKWIKLLRALLFGFPLPLKTNDCIILTGFPVLQLVTLSSTLTVVVSSLTFDMISILRTLRVPIADTQADCMRLSPSISWVALCLPPHSTHLTRLTSRMMPRPPA